jgi:2-polyprenyl-3-methyl-5-hydroxy-6-metoxy-1,4-benzoquinol methylase
MNSMAEDLSPELEYPSCPLCGEKAFRVAVKNIAGEHHIVRCGACRLRYLYPRLPESEMIKLYEDETYFSGEDQGYHDYALEEESLRKTFARLVTKISPDIRNAHRMLEIGCGNGYFLAEAKRLRELKLTALEMSDQSAEKARVHCADVRVGGLDALGPDERFDVIIALQVIEHIYDPDGFVTALKEHLNEGGTLILTTPDCNSPLRFLLGRRWPSYKTPEHVTYFRRSDLKRLLLKNGFSSAQTESFPHAFSLQTIANNLGITLPPRWAGLPLWIPWTSFTAFAVK